MSEVLQPVKDVHEVQEMQEEVQKVKEHHELRSFFGEVKRAGRKVKVVTRENASCVDRAQVWNAVEANVERLNVFLRAIATTGSVAEQCLDRYTAAVHDYDGTEDPTERAFKIREVRAAQEYIFALARGDEHGAFTTILADIEAARTAYTNIGGAPDRLPAALGLG